MDECEGKAWQQKDGERMDGGQRSKDDQQWEQARVGWHARKTWCTFSSFHLTFLPISSTPHSLKIIIGKLFLKTRAFCVHMF